jgi:hypothetical protein
MIQRRTTMTTKTSKKAAQASKKTVTLHIATPGSGKPICGASGKGIKTTLTLADATCAGCQKIAAHAAEKAKTEAKASSKVAAGKQAEAKKTAKPVAAAPRERDPRLPPVGTVLVKKDRTGATRCEATITATGVEYKGTEYRSLSGAAMAAAKDLGVAGAQNGFVFWSLVKPAPRVSDPLELLQTAWDRFHERASRAVATAKDDDAVRAKLKAALAGQVKKLEQLAE